MVRFMSKASASFIMAEASAQAAFEALGLERKPEGVVVVERIPALLARIAELMAAGRTQAAQQAAAVAALQKAVEGQPDVDLAAIGEQLGPGVGLHQRLVPLRDMLQRALARQEPVVWTELS